MFDSKRSGKRWNITFYDYSSNIGGMEAGPDYSMYTQLLESRYCRKTGSLFKIKKDMKCYVFDRKLIIWFLNVTDLGHFTDSSTGSLVTLDKLTGAVQWKVRIGSPIVALYLVQVFKRFKEF